MLILVVVDDNGSNESAINTEEVDLESKCGIDDKEIPVERYTETEDAVATSISADVENDDNLS